METRRQDNLQRLQGAEIMTKTNKDNDTALQEENKPDTSIHILFCGIGFPHFTLGFPKHGGGFEEIPDTPMLMVSTRGLREIIKHARWMEFEPIFFRGRKLRFRKARGET